ncbi:MAG: hypothetical protein H6659_14695 [Ardenticatenaceae bacterium]|nr:hypothetical protein [Ardenticatenaceae bacterium]MCB8986754.1 hypothetical protein [Ardenticatenaceae bacterium]
MSMSPGFDLQAAHRFFAADCFNRAWELIDKPQRTAVEDETMLQLSLASLWHWQQRPDCTDKNRSISYWQLARVYVLLGQPANARQAAQRCLDVTRRGELVPFYVGYAYEALARAAALDGSRAERDIYLQQAQQAAAQISGAKEKQQLLDDLATIS